MNAVVLDTVGRACPWPLIELGRALRSLRPGTQVLLLADDPVVLTDVPAWCAMVGGQLVRTDHEAADIRMLIRLPGEPPAATQQPPAASR